MLVSGREHRLHDIDGDLHELLLIPHKAGIIGIHSHHTDEQGEEVRLPLCCGMREMDEDGKDMGSQPVYGQTIQSA